MKTIDEMIAVMQAYKDGKEIECLCLCDGLSFCDLEPKWENSENPCWDWIRFDYRIKPEPPKPVYSPFENAEEFLQAQREHGMYFTNKKGRKEYYMPSIISTNNDNISVCGEGFCVTFEILFWNYIWQDGTPCGRVAN